MSDPGKTKGHAHTLILVRHGQSDFNKRNLCSGWADPSLTEVGVREAKEGGKAMKAAGIKFDVAYTSRLQRAVQTLFWIQEETGMHWVTVRRRWRLNERHYGALTGLCKYDLAQKFGEKQVKIWRRSFDVRPPAVDEKSEYYPANDERYKDVEKKLLPKCESLEDCIQRVLPVWHEEIAAELKEGKTVLVSAHGNALRGFLKHLAKISDEDIVEVNLPTGIPIVCELDKELNLIRRYFLADEAVVKKEIQAIVDQGKARPLSVGRLGEKSA
uniref:Phosphoglycerate mutase n=2 Tax=Lotharella globosa TaxID=91324 RepID=A0A6U3ARU0_9EUKA|eukprot:CAMPEP_0167790192 /NCGR_PEP_ID=MMETSP0111_2-20121227/11156_1 /TAXON_ID=91324 /ORGANISM="Lotharella globosa, Strain CCCM811" /LENGTH=270 /DNA_ID=CAMNT_0007682547 /DNA_START=61 /DNA_END=873 /DNA_ORIENTATION=-